MVINSFELYGVKYFQLYIGCPVCHEQGKYTPAVLWEHYGCGGEMYLGDNAHLHCNSCQQTFHIFNGDFICPEHSNSENYQINFQFERVSNMYLIINLGPYAGVRWLQKLLENIQ